MARYVSDVWKALLYAPKFGFKLSLRRLIQVQEIASSGLFDKSFYLELNPDVKAAGIDPIVHYVLYGAREGRSPSRSSDACLYLAKAAKGVYSPGLPKLARLQGEPWMINDVRVEANSVVVEGWGLPDSDIPAHSRLAFLLNGRPFDKVQARLPSDDVANLLWQREGAECSGFRCESTIAESPYIDGVMQITYDRPSIAYHARGSNHYFYPDPDSHVFTIPEPDQMWRVVANRDPNAFLFAGCTDYWRLNLALLSITGRGFADFDSILDWGVGCGRVARYVLSKRHNHFTGCDVDRGNIAWCKDRLPGSFVLSDMHPPLPFADGSFDLVYGISVFTHLNQELEALWLAELHRVVRPGGVVAVTIHGQTAVDYAKLSPEEHQQLIAKIRKEGVSFSSNNDQISGFADRADLYVNVFHDKEYVRQIWSKFFNIAEILPGYIYTHDLVVMLK